MHSHRFFTPTMLLILIATAGQLEIEAASGSPTLVQVLVGFNQPNNLGLPCTSPCLGIPEGTVIIQPNQLVSPGSPGVYFAAFQQIGWSGTLSVEFALREHGALVQTVVLDGQIDGEGVVLVSGAASIPQNGFVGPATLTVTTTATPNNGSAPLTLTSSSALEVGSTGTRRLVQVFAGSTAFACGPPHCAQPAPANAVEIQPNAFLQRQSISVYYVVFQANDWQGNVVSTCDLIERGRVVDSVPINGAMSGQGGHAIELLAATGSTPDGSYSGSVELRLTTTATQRDGSNPFTLTSYSQLELQ